MPLAKYVGDYWLTMIVRSIWKSTSLLSFSFLRTSQDIADDLVVFNPPKLPTTQMILFAEFLDATLFLKLSRETTNNSKKELIIGKGFFPSFLHGSVFFFYPVSI